MDTVDEIVGFEEPSSRVDRAAYATIGAAIAVHTYLGPGHPEAAYERAPCIELTSRGVPFVRQHRFTLDYKGQEFGRGCIDLLVDDCLIVEIKTCDQLAPVHTSQVIAYLKATNLELGLLINFNVSRLKDGIKRIARTR